MNLLERFATLWLSTLLCLLNAFPLANTVHAIQEQSVLDTLAETLSKTDDATTQAALMRGMLAGLAGRRDVPAPKKWAELSGRLSQSENAEVRELSSQLAAIFGDKKAKAASLRILRDKTAELKRRRAALRSLLQQRSTEASDMLEELLGEPELAMDAIRGYSIMENPAAPSLLLERFPKLNRELQRAVVETLATRKLYGLFAVEALKEGQLAKEDIPTHVARAFQDLLGESFTRVYGPVPELSQDREKLIAKYKSIITAKAMKTADASRGRLVYQKTCAACHLLYGEGGKIGPDLTGSNRANLDYFLLNSVDPSYDVPDGYRKLQILTDDDRVVTGVLAEEDDTRVVLKTVEQPTVTILKEDILTRKLSPKSMMPDGQLDEMEPQQILDLVKYLRTTEQVDLPK